MTDERLEEIRRREQSASPGPWERDGGCAGTLVTGNHLPIADTGFTVFNLAQCQLNGSFIAHARTDIPELLAEIDRLRAENARLRENTARRCIEIAECNGLYVTPESDYWAGVRHGYITMAGRIRREFGLEAKSE